MMVSDRRVKSLLILSLLLALFISSAATVKPVSAATITVQNSLDDGPGSLRQAISDANPGDRIIFAPNLSGGTITLTTGSLTIDKDLKIDSSDLDEQVIISGGNTFLVFYIYADVTVTLDSLSIQNGQGIYSGGIHNRGTLSLLNSVVSNNNANFGGGIFNCGRLNLTSNSLTGNTADNQGGGIYNSQSYECPGTLTVTDCQLSNNHAYTNDGDPIDPYDGYGGGIYNKGTLTVTNSALTENTSEDDGGGIYNEGTLTVTESNFFKNKATPNGGGIYNTLEGNLTITSSTFSENTAELYLGGGIFNEGTLTLNKSTLTGNDAVEGGGIFNSGTLTLTNSTLSGNFGDINCICGGIYNYQGTLTVTNSTIVGNFGDGIYNDQGTLNYANTIIANSLWGDDCVNFDGTIGTNTHNLVETGNCGVPYSTADPMLGPLADNGGPTLTHALLPGSIAIDAGSITYCPSTDQRGVTRPQGNGCDIGAFEFLKLDQVITFTSQPPDAVVGGPTYTPTATGGDSGNPVIFTIDASAASVCEMEGGDVSFIGVGTCVINANQAGDQYYNPADQAQQSFAVAKPEEEGLVVYLPMVVK